MKIFIGLGNPDSKYQHTRHNLGTQVVLRLVKNFEMTLANHPKTNCQIAKAGQSYFAITNEYMNHSGIAVAKLLNFFKAEPQDLYLIHDDLDLPVGEWRLQFDRGPAGHNGVLSTIDHLGTQAFWRYRIGIGHPLDSTPVESYVLQPFTPDEKKIISQTIDKIVEDIKQGH